MNSSPTKRINRCAACQLQICKSRDQPPHSRLTEVTRENTLGGQVVVYLCESCGVSMMRSADMGKPGWSSVRA